MLYDEDFENAKEVIKNAILERSRFKEIRKKLPDIGLLTIKEIIFDLYQELHMTYLPYASVFSL